MTARFLNDINIGSKELFAIAYSGGGDSTAILHLLRNHAAGACVYIVDHDLRADSAEEARASMKFSQGLGYKTEILKWQHENPETGLQEKARNARYTLLGAACRRAGVSHLVTGHTEDDQAETVLMRFDRNTGWRGAAGMGSEVHAPIWPALAGVTLHRPLLGASRAVLRDYNLENNLLWKDDPSNQNRKFARIRARDKISRSPEIRQDLLNCAAELQAGRDIENKRFREILKRSSDISQHGIIHLRTSVPANLLAYMLRAASGTGGPIGQNKLANLKTAISKPGFSGATLAGALITPAPKGGVYIGPDPATVTGRAGLSPIKPQVWPTGHPHLWGGRFWINSNHREVTVQPLSGGIAKLKAPFANIIKAVPAAYRGSLPMMTDNSGALLAVGGVSKHPDVAIISAVAPRLQAKLSRI